MKMPNSHPTSSLWIHGLKLALLLRGVGGHEVAHHSPGSLSVPGPPERATLEVIGATTLRAVFEPPLSDGGSKILSYLLEWDKEAGNPEVQTITTSQNLNSNEIQTITTSARDINEIQVVKTSATAKAEVQAITVSPPHGDLTIDSAYGFAISINTINVGGTLQYSGQISSNAASDGARSSVAQILENMANVHARPTVERSSMNPDGGHMYLVTFPTSMGNVPEMEVFMSDLPVTITTLQEGNELDGSFRLEFMGEVTADIPFDASSFEMQHSLEKLGNVHSVYVSRSTADEQRGYTWEIEFLSDSNGGNLPLMKVHGDGLRTSNAVGGENIEASTGRDGSYVSGTFTLAFRGDTTKSIPFDADASTVKKELEALSSIARIHVERTPLDIVGGCTWTVSFLEDVSRLHRGDMPELVAHSLLAGTPGESPSIVVTEERKGTIKEVQTITVDGGDGGNVDLTSSFKLRFEGEETGDILALPLGGNTCLGSTKAKQIITTSTVDTSGAGGDDSVSHLTTFALIYEGHITSNILANSASCEDTSALIEQELMKLPPLYEVSVSGSDTDAGDEGCAWEVIFLSVMGSPELMTLTASNGNLSADPSHSVTVGDANSIIQDTITISQPEGFEGDVNLIQSELSKLGMIGIVTVTPTSAVPDEFGQCTWQITFESKSGNISPLQVARGGTSVFSTEAELNSGNRVVVTDDTARGTSVPVSGDFRLIFDGEMTGYMPHDASSDLIKSSLDALPNIGDVAVTRVGPDVNGCYSWDVTFISDLGPLPRLLLDDLDLTGTVASMSVSKTIVGALPPFDGPDYGSVLVSDTDVSVLIPKLKQGIPYYVRISATNAVGTSPFIMPYPPFEIPLPRPPKSPSSSVLLEAKDGSTLAVAIYSPFHDGGRAITSYRVDYSTQPFVQERQRIGLTCSPQPAIQTVTTSATDINEVQFLVIDSSYSGDGEVLEVQRVMCDATGGTFGLSFGGETAYIAHDADSNEIKESLKSLSAINDVNVDFNNDKASACAPFVGLSAGDFSITFQSVVGMSGDLPLMTAESSGLEGARHVVVTTKVDGDAPLSGSLKLSFRGAMSKAIDISLAPNDLALAIELALEELDTIQQGGVVVEAEDLASGGYEKVFSITFTGSGVGGNVEALLVAPEHLLVTGSSANAFILSDGESYAARNAIETFTSVPGNVISGFFQLRLRGHTTRRISFNSSVDEMKARLEELSNIGLVDVQMSGPSMEMAYTWTITFISNPGYFPPSARIVDNLQVINELSTLVPFDDSATITVSTVRIGHARLEGQFQLTYDDGKTAATTRPLQSFISADDLKMELEVLPNIGHVTVKRSESLVGYEWDVEFTSCTQKNGLDVCNDGNLLPLVASNINLQGCGGPALAVTELAEGRGASSCAHLNSGLCFDEESFNGEYPIHHDIQGLDLGTPYFVQVRLRNSQSYGFRQLATPLYATPQHNAPGAPPPVALIASTSTSITVGWEKPTVNGGQIVSGYELWMDAWSGGEPSLVYDGDGSPNVMEFQLTTRDLGSHSQVVETGRQYRFQVRAINNCDTKDSSRSCFGEFSEVQVFTVRDPRAPLPPSMPQRDSETQVSSLNQATISISWVPPTDNGGSPIIGYILFMKDHGGTMTSYALDSEITKWQIQSLRPGEVYRFHVVAANVFGKSGNSPVLSTLAAMHSGLSYDGSPEYSTMKYRPLITDVQETALTVKWSHLPADISGGTPITGFKLYLYEYAYPLVHSDADYIKEEVQHIVISAQGQDVISGTFTASFRGYETLHIAVDADAETVKTELENLPSINLVQVDSIANGWSVAFLSEAGDLPLIQVTTGRLSTGVKIAVTEATKGDAAILIYDGSDIPGQRTFEALDLTPDTGYAFKVAPVNAVGDGVLSAASIVTIARAGASASKTTVSGSSLSKGIAGSIQEEQVITFLSGDCISDKLIMSFEVADQTGNLCGSSSDEMEAAFEELGAGNVHVSREEASSSSGHSGYSWSVTFLSRTGDVPLLTVDRSQVGYGRDALGMLGLDGSYVTEFLKGQSNEFVIEPKKASGAVIRDLSSYAGVKNGDDIFFTELWTSSASVIDGSHTWYSDGGVSTYNPVLYIEQIIAIPTDIDTFHLSMDTSETQPLGRIDGTYARTSDITVVSKHALEVALAKLPNVGKVHVSQTNTDHESTKFFIVTFRDVFGEYPLLAASDPSIMISLNDGHISATEVQTLTLSVDKPFVYEVQSVSISSNVELFYLSYKAGRTKTMPCNFQSISEAEDTVSSIEAELNSLPHVKVRVGTVVTGTGQEGSPWKFRITFLEPVGPLPLLTSDNAIIVQEVQGGSTLSGSVVLSYQGEYSDDIQYDASAKDVKDKLEMLSTIEEVNVRKYDMYTGYQWVVSFTGQAGNIPLLVAHSNVFEIQSIQTSGGIPTPLGGSFTLSYLSEETGPLPFDSSADLIKSSLESLPSITRVDVSETFKYGQTKWLVTFRLPTTPALLIVNCTNISGTLDDAVVSIEVDSLSPSLVAAVGSPPMIIVEEKVPGLPSYTGHYRANSTGTYSLAVLHLEGGGLNAKYYDNQWLLDEPVIERVDPTINFNWGSNIVTQYGRDYVSIRWWGKVRPLTSETYNFYLHADDGVRLYLDHKLIIDMWEPNSVEKKATAELTAGSYHDLKIEYKELTGDAYVRLEWSSRSLRKQIIPPSQLFYPSHIVGSPFQTTISPGAADYPHSTFIDAVDQNRSEAVAGERSTFYLQARDLSGNDKLTNGDDQGDMQSPEEQFTVDIVAHIGSVSGIVTYLKNGKYRVDYNVLKVGSYQVHVKTGGTDIYCGLGEENKCSPFILTVLPGATLASNCEVESSFNPVDSLVEARAGDIGKLYLQAKDAFGNNRIVGGDEVVARFTSVANPDIQYRGNVADREDGTYLVTYSIPLAGSFLVSITLGGESVQYCVGPHAERWHSRQYDGTSVYSSPSFCSLDDELYLHVIHRELHGVSTTLAEDGLSGLTNSVVGVETGFIVEARDKFGNLRTGSSTPNLSASGDGMSDAFLVSLLGPNGNAVVTSTSVEFLTCLDSSITGYFRLSYGGRVTPDIPHDFSAAAMQVILSSLHDTGANLSSVLVSRSTGNGNYQWKITFVDHLKLWSQYPLSVLPGSDSFRDVSDSLLVERQPSTGIYPVRFTLWDKGTYELSVFSGSTLVSGSSYTIEVTNGAPQASSSSAVGRGLEAGVAGEESSFLVQVRDKRQSEIQSILTSAVVIDFIQEKQRLKVVSDIGESFRIEFRGQTTSLIDVGLSTLSDVADALEALPTIGQVSVSSDGVSSIITKGHNIDIVFLTEHGNLDSLKSTGPEIITEMVQGEAPYRAERQSIYCNALGGYVVLSFKDSTATIEFDDDIDTVASKLSALVGEPVAVVTSDDSITSICTNNAAKVVFVDFPLTLGNLEALDVSINALEPADGYMTVFGNGEEFHGAVNGINLIMGYYRLVYEGESTIPISADASAEEVKVALDNLPSIGSVGVTKEMFGLRLGMDGQNDYPGKVSLFIIWTITFADDSKDGCEPGFWDICPANIGDLPSLMVDPTLLTYEIGATQQQLSPKIKIVEVKKGSTGNTIDSADSPADIEFSLSHNLIPDVGIELHEVHTLSCSYSTEALVERENEGSFELIILNKNIIIDALTPLHEFALILLEALDLTHSVSTAGSTHETVCHFDPSNPVTAVSKLTFSREDGPIPSLYVCSEQSVMVAVDNLIDAVDSVEYLGGGRYNVTYTPTVSGHYSASIKVNDKSIWSDISKGVFVDPAVASAHYCTHDSDLVAVAGKEESYDVVARDRFGNKLLSTMRNGTSLVLSLNGVSDACIGLPRNDRPSVLVKVLETSHPDGHYKVAYTPILAGTYESSIMLRSRGGLLATYFKNQDFTEPVYGNDYHNSLPYHETPWCAADKPLCDSTRLDTDISFDWGLDSPILSDPSFPMDSFSARWEGEIKVDKTDNYTFSCLFNGGIRLTVGGRVLIDSLIDTNTESLSSTPVILEDGVFHSIKVEYVHFTDEARMQLFWRSSSMPRQNVPSRIFYYTRHIGGSSLSPFSIHVSPGEIDTSSSAEGDGLLSCVSMAECSFVIQTKDANHNNRYTYGSDPGFEIDLRGNSGWAAEGRVNGVVTLLSPVVVSGATVTSNDWRYIGEADAVHLSSRLATKSNFMGILLRGDNIAIDGIMYTVSPTGKFDSTSIPLLSPYLGPTKQVAVFKASKVCHSGTHTVKYTPSVRGSYLMDVRLPTDKEVQRVTTSTHSHSSLSGAFTLTYHGEVGAAPLVSGSIEFDASSDEFRMALESIETIGSVDVSRHECDYPSISCSWDVTFLSLEGDVNMLVSSKIHLGGEVSEIRVDEIVQGRRPKSIAGFPRTIAVSPGETSPSMTTAYGKGLVSVTAGDKATFVIQPKDSFGNDRLADQKEDLFGVFIFPEKANVDGLFPVTKGTLNRVNEGFFMVEYTPKTSGWHTVAAVQAVSSKRQQITTGYTSKARGGTFTIELGNLSTLPISWDSDEEALKNALDLSMEGISSFDVQKHTHGRINFRYVISYVSLLGDVTDFSVDTSNIIGSTVEWDIASLSLGKFAHIKVDDEPTYEIQSINLKVIDQSMLEGAKFSLTFMGQRTDPIPWNANVNELKQKLEVLNTVGDIIVSLDVDEITNDRVWKVTFNPFEGKSPNSLVNFGNLSPLQTSLIDASISVVVEFVEDGSSPYRVWVKPSETASSKITAYDHSGVPHFEGLTTGVYKTDSLFFVQSRDEFSNAIQDGPLKEVQIIQTSSSSQIGGFFEISMYGKTVRIEASAFTSELEKQLQSIPGIGSVTVTSNSAKDLVVGKTMSVSKGLSVVTPSVMLSEFTIGDWIRIGDQDGGQLFSITDMSEVTPFTITLSSPYLGKSDPSAKIYQHGLPHNRLGYQYIVSFDAVLGDLPSLIVDGALLDGDNANVAITSCDWNIHQRLDVLPTSGGYFYLVYKNEQTRVLSVDASAEELQNAIVTDIAAIETVLVTHLDDSDSFAIHLMSFEGDAELFFVEGHMLIGGTIVMTPICPVDSSDRPLYSVESVAGRRGDDFVITLDGSANTTVRGIIENIEGGRYLATYNTPRVGTYSLSIQAAHAGGLAGEYYNNRWLYGSPTLTRVDESIDFQRNNNETVTTTGKDFISIRWTGYIKPVFDEIYTFTAHVNDALRLWVGSELLIDEFEHEVNDTDEYLVFSATTIDILKADQLVEIKVEFRENRGQGMIKLFWESISQPFALIDQPRMYYNASHIHGSPFRVTPQAIKPSSPTLCSVEIAGWNSLRISWAPPGDDGGIHSNAYLVESWDASNYGTTEKQQLRIKRTITGGTYSVSLNSHQIKIPVRASALEVEKLMQSIPIIGDVNVLKSIEGEVNVYDVEFRTNNAPIPTINIDTLAATPESERSQFCVCAKGSETCATSGSQSMSCNPDASREGSVNTESYEVEVANNATIFSYTIGGLDQTSDILDGFGVRVSSKNTQGLSIPCPSLFLKPYSPPLPPAVVELKRVASNPSSLAVHFTSVTSPHDKGSVVTSYNVEWSTLDTFTSGSVRNATLDADSVPSERLPSLNSVNEEIHYFLLEGLNPGVEYFVRISAVNKAGAGPTSRSRPLSLAPGSKPTDIDDQNGVIISTMAVDTANVTVEESSSSLLVSWRSPFSENGFGISKYLIEYWVQYGVNEVREIVLQSENGLPARGTFALGYGEEKTCSLSVDSSNDIIKEALESLSTIRAMRVWRSGENPEYKWTITFVSEYPSVRGLMLRVEDSELSDSSGGSLSIQINVLTAGVLPIGYMTKVVPVVNQSRKHYSYILTGLTAGQPYSVQVSAANELGYGRPQTSIPRELAPPVQKPSSPTNVNLSVASSQSLEVIFSRPKSDGGETISLYRIEWDPKETFDSLNNSPIGSYTLVSGCEPCKHQFTGLVKGLNYYVRVYAYNSYGYSVKPGLPTPRYLSPKTTPNPPRYLHLSPKSDTEIEVSFPREVNDDGGAPVTKYKIEWNLMGYFAGMPSMNTDHRALLYSQHNVQSITLSADDDDLGGTFRIAFGGHTTDEVSVKSTAHDMKRALESLPTMGTVVVSREYIPNGVTWAVTFLINHSNDDRYGPIESLTVSIDPTALPTMFATDILEGTGLSLIGTGAKIAVKEEVTAFKGYEQQTLTMQCGTSNGILSGHFSLTFEGARTKDILTNATALDLKLELESIASLGKVQISRRKIHGKINSFQWSVIFLDRLGTVPMLVVHDHLVCSDGSNTPLIFVTETSQSVLPRMDGLYAGNVELNAADFAVQNEIVHFVGGLRRGLPYHFRVSAYNGAGKTYGKSQYSMPSILIPVDRPDPPTSVEMSSIDNTTIQIKWDAALAKGGSHNILKYKVELAEKAGGVEVYVQSFDVENRPEVQEIILESSADDMEGHITVQFMGEYSSPIDTASDASDVKQALEGLSTIGTVDVSIFTHTQDSMSVYGRRWVITFTSLNGNLPLLLVGTSSGPSSTMATGGTLLGSSSIARVRTVLDGGLHTSFITPSILSPKKTYISRVQAFNGHSWSDPATSRYSISPTKVAPSPPREVRVNVLSDTTLGVSWLRPQFSGGDPIASYRVEWDSGSLFDHSSQLVPATPGKESYFSVITNLGPNESFYVRVLSYSAMGFSEPRIALPLLSNSNTISISLIASNAIELTETFALEYSTSDGFSRVTDSISVFATPNEIADELNQFAHVSVDREDHSFIFDSSGIETNVFSILYRITFFGDKSITLTVVDDNLGQIVATVI